MDKEELRAQLKRARESIPEQEVGSKSNAIASKVLHELDWAAIKSAHVYNSVADWKEVDTHQLIKKVAAHWPEVRFVSPAIDRDNPIPHERFDLIIVPVIGFDARRNRIGLGGGWYDKFLVTQPDALKVGLAFESALVPDGIQPEHHDIVLDKIITEVNSY